jgi:hypothetical protein
MAKEDIYVNINEASTIIKNFIGTDSFYAIIDALEDNARAGFTAGLSFALCLMLAESQPIVVCKESPRKSSD